MKKHTVDTFFGSYKVTLSAKKYSSNDNLAIQMYCWNDDEYCEPFARLTVNLDDKLPENKAFVDVNNCPWAERFIEENGLGRFTGVISRSGYCAYPLYEFDIGKIAV